MAGVLLSTHSSNPLKVGSSDPETPSITAHTIQEISRSSPRRSPVIQCPLKWELSPPELDDYHAHISQLFPGMIRRRSSVSTIRAGKQPMFAPRACVDLDVDMSDDELLIRPDTGVGLAPCSSLDSRYILQKKKYFPPPQLRCESESKQLHAALLGTSSVPFVTWRSDRVRLFIPTSLLVGTHHSLSSHSHQRIQLRTYTGNARPAAVDYNDEEDAQGSDVDDDDVQLSGEPDPEDEDDTIHPPKPPEQRAEIAAEIEELQSPAPNFLPATSSLPVLERVHIRPFIRH
ncbi:hypothetical protein PC9H_002327 [Pleurotus ostreatus]|uniref:Uncharacterized protein n=1 Tax=Pleurotus ostreatus TaxID=5322 RepID=A0A8H7DLK3_PLEOS|nr:uncharacterized protein PC9H_002327 [Pleurotus ostreatus]KAF7416067.1 hypothetical protein PC9H_002327 [Pleurotus ostreatus]KAJ8688875.1 hypothetical protein PTI98_012953 [Pleurotus ostreatus]